MPVPEELSDADAVELLILVSVGVEARGPEVRSPFIVDLDSLLSLSFDVMSRNFISFFDVLLPEEACLLFVNASGLILEQPANKARKADADRIFFSIVFLF